MASHSEYSLRVSPFRLRNSSHSIGLRLVIRAECTIKTQLLDSSEKKSVHSLPPVFDVSMWDFASAAVEMQQRTLHRKNREKFLRRLRLSNQPISNRFSLTVAQRSGALHRVATSPPSLSCSGGSRWARNDARRLWGAVGKKYTKLPEKFSARTQRRSPTDHKEDK